MIASIILAATICTANINEKCDVEFEHTYVTTGTIEDFKFDALTCFKILESYPEEQKLPDGKSIIRGCYVVNTDSGIEGQSKLENMLIEDDSFFLRNDLLEVK